ncbi:Sulfotransferase domain protein [Tritonibacter multivorans]|uniref:Sulfotransferase domain protein n=1 Tax=Tritonibacter multivorans TaxID=928856 RepID=A0A0P1GAY9_9RHOB|nr:sulfotransferase [Tritonibacter multivorans]MDA7422051.1 sulfotransferase [Tritonibacter multivorans]CUH78565.1 Sulfotransferase domain protein [Tritonibacter multivorans]SFD18554.1 Sulfotransferase family protein [Tritonibacter multivorans]
MSLPPPIFLIAPPRSFTTLVSGMLGVHPDVYGVPELTIFYRETLSELWTLGRADTSSDTRMRHGILRAVAEIFFGEQTDAAIAGAERWCARRQDWHVRDVFTELRAAVAPLRLLEKSPDYTLKPEAMLRFFESCPDCKIIFLTRHPVGQCKSTLSINDGAYPFNCNSFAFENGQAILDPQIAWHDMNVNVLNFLETHVPKDQYLRVMGEALLADPEGELKNLCRWLGIRDDEDAIEQMKHPERSPFANFGPISALFGNDPNFQRNPHFKKQRARTLPPLDGPLPWRKDGATLYPEVRALAEEFGY